MLALLLGDPALELSLTELGDRLGMAAASVHREVERAEAAGIVRSRRVGRTRIVSADDTSPYFSGLADVLVKAFGPPWVLASALDGVAGIERAVVYGSWAAGYAGQAGRRSVGDLDLLVLGEPDRDDLLRHMSTVEDRLGRPVQLTIRPAGWLEDGSGSFHDTVVAGPLVEVAV